MKEHSNEVSYLGHYQFSNLHLIILDTIGMINFYKS